MSKKQSPIKTFGFAFEGIKQAIHEEPNLRFHILAAILVLVLAFFLQLDILSFAVLILTISSVIVLELINTIIERITDMISPEISVNAKFIKDVSASAVLVSAIAAVLVGLLLFAPRILQLLFALIP
ncbi:diacylglycerol kinase family protein [soil metagenome]